MDNDRELKGRFEIQVIADPHKVGDAINEFLQKLKEIEIENAEDRFGIYLVSVNDAWVEDEEEEVA